jgi:hypothetical protein
MLEEVLKKRTRYHNDHYPQFHGWRTLSSHAKVLTYHSCGERMEIDRELVATARRFINGANVHCVNTWIFCYQLSAADSPLHARYENLLRDFIRSRSLLKTLNHSIALQRRQLDKLKVRSVAINRRIEKLLTSHSD